jgi:hypothetical protein
MVKPEIKDKFSPYAANEIGAEAQNQKHVATDGSIGSK